MNERTANPVRNIALRVLVVDDETVVRDLLSGMLTQAGCNVTTAAEPRTVLDDFDSNQFDLVVMDAEIGPRVDGILLAGQLQQFDPKLRVVIISGNTENEARAREEGFGFLSKPFAEKDVEALLAGR
ncbi:MAG: response regulator [Elusimicrobia bacterium]|nr:response regulator [Elusimicrobiota bacterium]